MRRYVILGLVLLLLNIALAQDCDNACSDSDCFTASSTRSIACVDSDTKIIEKQNWFAPCMIAELDNLSKANHCCAWDLNWSFFEYEDCDESQSCVGGTCRNCNSVANQVCDVLCISIDPDCTDLDNDGTPSVSDCDDSDPQVYPGANEVCDGKDNNCDGIMPSNENDADKDGYLVCNDCNDYNSNIYPSNKNTHCSCPSEVSSEICDNKIDDDCDGDIDGKDFECTDIFDQALGSNSVLIANASISKGPVEKSPVQFFDRSRGDKIVNRLWDFGDGSTSNLKDPFHTYGGASSYNVVLTVTDSKNEVDTFSFLVNIGCMGNCSANEECDDDNDLTVDVCSLSGTCGANCKYLTCKPKCIKDSDCNDDNEDTNEVCIDIGGCNSYCKYTPANFDFEIVSPIADRYSNYEVLLNVSVIEGAKCSYQLNNGNIVSLKKTSTIIEPRYKDNELKVKCSIEGLELEKSVSFFVSLSGEDDGFFTKFWKYVKGIFTKKEIRSATDEERGSILKEAFGGRDSSGEVEKSKQTARSSEIEKTAEKDENGTTISVKFKPDKVMTNVTIYEKVPKSVAESANDIVFNNPNVEIIEDDPLFVWHFEEITTEVDLSYKVKGDVGDEVPVTVPVAQELGEDITEEMVNAITGSAVSSSGTGIAKVMLPLAAIPVIGLVIVLFSKFSKTAPKFPKKAMFEDVKSNQEKELTNYIINHVILGEDQDEIKSRLLKEGKDPMMVKRVFSDLETDL